MTDEVNTQRLSTAAVPAPDRYAFWQSSLSASHHPVHLSPADGPSGRHDPADFRADFLRVDAAGAKISIGSIDPVRTETRAADARQQDGRVVHLSLHDGGRQVVESRQGRHVLTGRTVLLQSDDEANVQTHLERVPMVLLSVSADLLTVPVEALRSTMFVPLPADDAVRVLMLSAAETARTTSGSLDRIGMSAYLSGVAELVLRRVVGRSLEHQGTEVVRRAQVREQIRGRLADPHLTTASVAGHVGVTPRRLHQLFEGGPTVAEQIRTARMELAAALLRDPLWADQPVAAVARRCGYLDHSQFSRAFRRFSGTTPTDFRP